MSPGRLADDFGDRPADPGEVLSWAAEVDVANPIAQPALPAISARLVAAKEEAIRIGVARGGAVGDRVRRLLSRYPLIDPIPIAAAPVAPGWHADVVADLAGRRRGYVGNLVRGTAKEGGK